MTKRSFGLLIAIFIGSLLAAVAQAPAGATGQCKDGTFTTASVKKGACADHRGVKTWFKANPAAVALPSPAASGESAKTSPAYPASSGTTTPNASMPAPSVEKSSAPGAQPGQVWLNTGSNVYHCPGSTYYGKTHDGTYMTEAQAKIRGARPAYNKPCNVQ